jgi:hypothetical protein
MVEAYTLHMVEQENSQKIYANVNVPSLTQKRTERNRELFRRDLIYFYAFELSSKSFASNRNGIPFTCGSFVPFALFCWN